MSSKTQADEEPALISHFLNPATAIAYARLLLLVLGWVLLEMGSPEFYFAHYVA